MPRSPRIKAEILNAIGECCDGDDQQICKLKARMFDKEIALGDIFKLTEERWADLGVVGDRFLGLHSRIRQIYHTSEGRHPQPGAPQTLVSRGLQTLVLKPVQWPSACVDLHGVPLEYWLCDGLMVDELACCVGLYWNHALIKRLVLSVTGVKSWETELFNTVGGDDMFEGGGGPDATYREFVYLRGECDEPMDCGTFTVEFGCLKCGGRTPIITNQEQLMFILINLVGPRPVAECGVRAEAAEPPAERLAMLAVSERRRRSPPRSG